MSFFQLSSAYKPSGDQPNAISKVVDALAKKTPNQTILGVTGSGKTFTMANIIAETGRPALVMAPNKTLAAQLFMEFRALFPHNAVEYFVSYYDYYQPEAYIPSSDTFIDKDAKINDQIEKMRLSATKSLLERRDVIVVSSVSSIYGLGDPREFQKMRLFLEKGGVYTRKSIIDRLVEMQYNRNDLAMGRGDFRVRGEIIDVWPGDSDEAIRIEMFDGAVEKICSIDPVTGKHARAHHQCNIYPKSHYVSSRQRVLSAIEGIKEELWHRVQYFYKMGDLIKAQRLQERVLHDIEMLHELSFCSGIENYSRHLSGGSIGAPPSTLYHYLPDDAVVFIDESHVSIPQIGGMFFGDRSRKENLVDHGFRLPSALDNRPLSFQEWESLPFQKIFISATPGAYEHTHSKKTAELVVRPTGLLDPEIHVRPQSAQVDDVLIEIKKAVSRGERALITTLTKKMSEDLTEYLVENGIKARYLHSNIENTERLEILRDLRLAVCDVLVGINLLREGLDIPEVSFVGVLDADKEGFLRSESSLIQTAGRAARNKNGCVVFYASHVTKSMQKAIDETARRRKIQEKYNNTHGITPTSIQKPIMAPAVPAKNTIKTSIKKVAQMEDVEHIALLGEKEYDLKIKDLSKKMKDYAQNMSFEEAIALREHIREIKEKRILFGFS